MNDYETLIDFIRSKVALAATGHDYRELHDYFIDKFDTPGNSLAHVYDLGSVPLRIAGLDPDLNSANVSTLNQPANAHLRACGAVMLAAGIIRNPKEQELKLLMGRLRRIQTPAVENELLDVLRKGELVRSQRYPRLELKNFGSSGSQRYRSEIEDAYSRAHDLLLRCEMQFVFLKTGLTGNTASAFQTYFGSPTAPVDPTTLPFKALGRPTFTGTGQTRLSVVREVLRRVCANFVRQDVRVSFGGRLIDGTTFAYVSGKINPTRIHVGGLFFGKPQVGLGSEAGTIIHECTHTFAGTEDHIYGAQNCVSLLATDPLEALTNADSYKFFCEAAFG